MGEKQKNHSEKDLREKDSYTRFDAFIAKYKTEIIAGSITSIISPIIQYFFDAMGLACYFRLILLLVIMAIIVLIARGINKHKKSESSNSSEQKPHITKAKKIILLVVLAIALGVLIISFFLDFPAIPIFSKQPTEINDENETAFPPTETPTPTLTITPSLTPTPTPTLTITPSPTPTPTLGLQEGCFPNDWEAYLFPSYKQTNEFDCVTFNHIEFVPIENGIKLHFQPYENTDNMGIYRTIITQGTVTEIQFQLYISNIINLNTFFSPQLFIGVINSDNRSAFDGVLFTLTKQPMENNREQEYSYITFDHQLLFGYIENGDVIDFSLVGGFAQGFTYTVTHNGHTYSDSIAMKENWNDFFIGYSLVEDSTTVIELRNLKIIEQP